jgi:hypothetical protein
MELAEEHCWLSNADRAICDSHDLVLVMSGNELQISEVISQPYEGFLSGDRETRSKKQRGLFHGGTPTK